VALTKNDLYVGKMIYRLRIENNMHSRRKITMIDADGNEWHRYDINLWTYTICPMNICGSIKQVVKGIVDEAHIEQDSYHLKQVNDKKDSISVYYSSELVDDDPSSWTQFFSYHEDAMTTGEKFCDERNAK
jgi:hypothetical protein